MSRYTRTCTCVCTCTKYVNKYLKISMIFCYLDQFIQCTYMCVIVHVAYSRKFPSGKIFNFFAPCSLYPVNFCPVLWLHRAYGDLRHGWKFISLIHCKGSWAGWEKFCPAKVFAVTSLILLLAGSWQVHHKDAEGEGSSCPPESVQPLVPILLEIWDTAHLQGSAKLVHKGGDTRRKPAGKQ